ncbi:hypothetical protein DFH06DRAFT_612853 [Mycena polygramma]|nr:hypothetical protein DFH06DRAFT_612853 [Mycena polygramma]
MSGKKCTNCTDSGLECTFAGTVAKRRSYVEALESRLEMTEQLLRKLTPQKKDKAVSPLSPESPNNTNGNAWSARLARPAARRARRHAFGRRGNGARRAHRRAEPALHEPPRARPARRRPRAHRAARGLFEPLHHAGEASLPGQVERRDAGEGGGAAEGGV